MLNALEASIMKHQKLLYLEAERAEDSLRLMDTKWQLSDSGLHVGRT